jgi:hypothetical protein
MAFGAECIPDCDAAGTPSVATWAHLHNGAGLCWCAYVRLTTQEDHYDAGLVGGPVDVVGGHG